MNNTVLRKTVENMIKHRDIKLVTTEVRRNYFVSKPSYQTTTFFIEKILAIEIKVTKIRMKKPVYLGLSILELSKISMYYDYDYDVLWFWYDYVEPKYSEKTVDGYRQFDCIHKK